MTDDSRAGAPHDLTMVHIFEAPRERVFRNWVEPDHVRTWFAPDGFAVTVCEIDARPGGRWRVEYRSDSGVTYLEHGEFHEVVHPERLVFSLMQEDGSGHSRASTVVTVTFAQKGAKTEVTFHQTGFDSAATRDGNAEGWKECFHKLERHLAR
ncbi:MAG: SRPBCC domain-containing protein [Luteitalea sp.]|nr:SRPBCC domain-containing protein [Luteitalea sp.]